MSARIISNIWYGDLVGADHVDPPRRRYAAQATAAWRLLHRSREYDLIVTSEGRIGPPGLVVLCVGLALSRKRKLAVMEFLPGTKRGILGSAVAFTYRRLLRRVCVLLQVMTEDELATYSDEYNIPRELLRHLPYYHLDDRISPDPSRQRRGIFSSGRQSCDWESLLAAAEDQEWDLTIVCSETDYKRIRGKAAEVGAHVEFDIPPERHDEMLARAAVCVISLTDDRVSSGHTRLMAALSRGVPTILSGVAGVRGYESLASVVVPPNDPLALRAAISESVSDSQKLSAALAKAITVGEQWTYSKYCAAIRDALENVLK